MQLCSFSVLLGGDRNHVIQMRTTVPEIEVLRTLHGDEAVVDIEVVGNPDVNQREERDRLKKKFKKNLPAPDASGRKNVVDVVFPNPRANLPTQLKEIGITAPQAPAKKGPSKKLNAQSQSEGGSAKDNDGKDGNPADAGGEDLV